MTNKRELDKLRRRFGEFERVSFEFRSISPHFGAWVQKLTKRRGEIILVVPRGKGRVLLHTKPHYPDSVFRLPTGGIHPRETALDAAQREGFEEIGFKPKKLELLGVLDNVFWLPDQKLVYPSFVFQTEKYTGEPSPTDPDEEISGFRDADMLELETMAILMTSLPAAWKDWGRFRAAPHTWLVNRQRT
ncbi:MAG: NUDIX hydrolase [Anaerolineae bacterium]|nr:NUDIX hydrolase [Anaerolineae bacterium]